MDSRSPQSPRLESWKEIARHLNRTVRTVQRWEREQGLPVRRLQHNKQATIFAYADELDEWWQHRRVTLEREDLGEVEHDSDVVPVPPPPARRRGAFIGASVIAIVAVAAIGAAWSNRTTAAAVAPAVRGDVRQSAFLAYRRGAYQLAKRNPEGLRNATDEFMRAARLDPNYAAAHAGLADAYLLMGIFGVRPAAEAYRDAKLSAEHALALDPNNAEACTALAFVTELNDHDWFTAESLFKRAIASEPSNVQAHHWYGLLLDSTLRGEEAIREIENALAFDGLSLPLNSDLGMVMWHVGHYDRAIAQLKRTIGLDPSYADAYSEIGAAYLHSGDYARASDAFAKARELGTNPAHVHFNKVFISALRGDMTTARTLARQMEFDSDLRAHVSPGYLGSALLAIGDYDRALDLLVANRTMFDANLLIGRVWRPVYRDPRFRQLVERHGFLDLAARDNDFRNRLESLIGPLPTAGVPAASQP